MHRLSSSSSNGFHHQRNSLRDPQSHQALQRRHSRTLLCLSTRPSISSRPRNRCLLQRHHHLTQPLNFCSSLPPSKPNPKASHLGLLPRRRLLPRVRLLIPRPRYLNRLVSEAQVLAVSIEYRLAPESPLPAAYEDCWAALQWVASHSINQEGTSPKEPWLFDFGDFDRIYIGGDSAGGNIAHNIAMKAGVESLDGGVKILGGFVSHPGFGGSKPIGSEPKGEDFAKFCLFWNFVYPSADGGIDNPMINPMVSGAPSLAGLGCSRLACLCRWQG